MNPLQYALICGVGGMISQIGDLAASGIKRNHGIKDYGKLIPGHGGICLLYTSNSCCAGADLADGRSPDDGSRRRCV